MVETVEFEFGAVGSKKSVFSLRLPFRILKKEKSFFILV